MTFLIAPKDLKAQDSEFSSAEAVVLSTVRDSPSLLGFKGVPEKPRPKSQNFTTQSNSYNYSTQRLRPGGTQHSHSVATQMRDGIQHQHRQELCEQGESITIMVVGESGTGKTSLLSNLFHTPLDWPAGERTKGVKSQSVKLRLGDGKDDVTFQANLIDSPGWGDTLNLRRNFDIITDYIEKCFWQQLKRERAIERKTQPGHELTQHVDVILYVFAPHRCKGIDIEFIKKLQKPVAVVPVLAKADTMTREELLKFRSEVLASLSEANIQVAHPPFAVVCSYPNHGRGYPWGVAQAEDEKQNHSELPQLRNFLLTDGLLKLKKDSQKRYEDFRAKALQRQCIISGLRWLFTSFFTSCAVAAVAMGKDSMPAQVFRPGTKAFGQGLRTLGSVLRGHRRHLVIDDDEGHSKDNDVR